MVRRFGTTKISEFVHGTGTSIWYHEDGAKYREAPYVNGKQHGTQIWYYKDGSKLSEIPYLDGKKHGTMIDYREDGSKGIEIVYENGEEISRKKF